MYATMPKAHNIIEIVFFLWILLLLSRHVHPECQLRYAAVGTLGVV